MFVMPLEKYWLGPTIYTWGKEECNVKKLRTFRRDDLGTCQKICESTDYCNAIIVEYANSQVHKCHLKACTFPVPAPCGQSCGVPVNELRGYYRATGKQQIDI